MLRYKFLLHNTYLAVALFIAILYGWADRVWAGDSSRISLIIVGVFIFAFLWQAKLAWRNQDDEATRIALAKIDWFAEKCTLLGLIGTVVGAVQLFAAFDITNGADIGSVKAQFSEMAAGVGVAFLTTLVGAVAFYWLTHVRKMLWPLKGKADE